MNKGTNTLRGKERFRRAAEFGLIAAIAFSVCASSDPVEATSSPGGSEQNAKGDSLTPPAQGSIPIGFLLSEGAVMIDFSGPWEVFQDVMIPGRTDHPFHLYTVSESTSPIHTSGGMKIVLEYTFGNAPASKVIVLYTQIDTCEYKHNRS